MGAPAETTGPPRGVAEEKPGQPPDSHNAEVPGGCSNNPTGSTGNPLSHSRSGHGHRDSSPEGTPPPAEAQSDQGIQVMDTEVIVNSTVIVTDLHPCYEIIDFGYKLTTTPSVACVLLYGFLMLLSAVTVCGNLLVVISIIYFKQLHTPTNTLILSLAVADLLVGILVFPLSMAFSLSSLFPLSMSFSLSSCLYYRDLFCKIRDSFDVILSSTSISNLCCISVDRYYAVCQPLTYRAKINTSAVLVMILMSWGISILVAIGFIIVELNQEKCQNNCFSDAVLEKVFAPMISFYLPVTIMLYIYLRIFLVAKRQARSIQNAAEFGAIVNNMERKATKTLAIVLGVFLMCWLPFFLCFSFQLLGGVSVMVYEALNWLALSNSMLNPFIYAFFYSWFRSAFKMIISGKIFQENPNTKLL
ncbi:trace amine-associated receptor 1-like [Anableps anableps]